MVDFSAGHVKYQNLLRLLAHDEQSIAGGINCQVIEAAFYRSRHFIFRGQLQRRGCLREMACAHRKNAATKNSLSLFIGFSTLRRKFMWPEKKRFPALERFRPELPA